MDKVTLHGRVYERSAVVAKRHGYTADYLGQLSRDGKVDAELVGRSWYVNSESVEAYKRSLEEDDVPAPAPDTEEGFSVPVHTVEGSVATKTRAKIPTDNSAHIHPRADEKSFHINISRPDDGTDTPSEESLVPATKAAGTGEPSTKKTAESATSEPGPRAVDTRVPPYEAYARWRQAAYEPDDAELLPSVQRNEVPVSETTAFDEQDASEIRVHSETDQYSIITGDLPAVRLRGSIPLEPAREDIQESDYDAAHDIVQKRITELNRHHTPRRSRQKHERSTTPQGRSEAPAAASSELDNAGTESAPSTASYRTIAFYAGVFVVAIVCGVAAYALFAVESIFSTETATHGFGLRSPAAVWEQLQSVAPWQ